MLAKLTSKNQLTLPKAAVQAVGATVYFDVAVRAGQIVLTPVRIQRADAVRAKLAALGLGDADLADAVRWARSAEAGDAAPVAAEPVARYGADRAAVNKPAARRVAARPKAAPPKAAPPKAAAPKSAPRKAGRRA